MGFSNMMMAAARSMPKSTISQSIPSLTYSSCSTTNMWWLKNCKIHAKVNHLPVNTLLDVFLLFNNEHVVVEELQDPCQSQPSPSQYPP